MQIQWAVPSSASYRLDGREIHIWRAYHTSALWNRKALTTLLSIKERARAEDFIRKPHATSFLIQRGLLRIILGRYLGKDPKGLRFAYGPHGKPRLASKEYSGLEFNLSHSHELTLFAISNVGPIGVDLEYMRRTFDYQRIAKRFFSTDDMRLAGQKWGSDMKEAFFDIWVRHEARLKAHGSGLMSKQRDLASNCNSINFSPAPVYKASIAGMEKSWNLQGWDAMAIDRPL